MRRALSYAATPNSEASRPCFARNFAWNALFSGMSSDG